MLNRIYSFFNFKKNKITLSEEVFGNWHVDFILHLATIIKPRCYVELGLYQGELFNKMIPYCDTLHGVDMDETVSKFIKKSPKVNFYGKSTSDFSKHAKSINLQIDLLFIDADHSYDSVLNDFNSFFPMVRDNGIILIHDSYPKNKSFTSKGYCGDGYKAIEELGEKADNYEIVTIPIHPGLSIIRKRKSHLQWLQKK